MNSCESCGKPAKRCGASDATLCNNCKETPLAVAIIALIITAALYFII